MSAVVFCIMDTTTQNMRVNLLKDFGLMEEGAEKTLIQIMSNPIG
jgi:hypothetical protein